MNLCIEIAASGIRVYYHEMVELGANIFYLINGQIGSRLSRSQCGGVSLNRVRSVCPELSKPLRLPEAGLGPTTTRHSASSPVCLFLAIPLAKYQPKLDLLLVHTYFMRLITRCPR